MRDPEPGVPDADVIVSPGVCPCNACVSVGVAASACADGLMMPTSFPFSRFRSVAPVAVTTT